MDDIVNGSFATVMKDNRTEALSIRGKRKLGLNGECKGRMLSSFAYTYDMYTRDKDGNLPFFLACAVYPEEGGNLTPIFHMVLAAAQQGVFSA